MLFERCRSVHTVGMATSIRVVAVDRQRTVRWVRVVAPNRFVRPRRRIRSILEGTADLDMRVGDRLRIVAPAVDR
jgi:hypothetical protein